MANKVARRLVRRGRRAGETRKEILAALQTGLVETGLRNISHGDADSVNWRQERGHYGSVADRMKLNQSIDRFYDETSALDDGEGMKPWELAAAVQRPAEEYRTRYRDRGPEAKRLLQMLSGSAGSGGAGGFKPVKSSVSPISLEMGGGQATDPADERRHLLFATLDNLNQAAGVEDPLVASNSEFLKQLSTPQLQPQPTSELKLGGGSGVVDIPGLKGVGGVSKGAAKDLKTIVQRANRFDKMERPYLWGGGHGAKPDYNGPWDCSGAVSAVLGVDPRVSGQFESWGKPGRGKRVTIYANATHVLMEINGKFWGTSGSNPGGGAGWIPGSAVSKDYLSRFVARHPPGL